MTRNSHLNFELKCLLDIDTAISNFTETIHNAKINSSFLAHKFKFKHLIIPEFRQRITQKRKICNRW